MEVLPQILTHKHLVLFTICSFTLFYLLSNILCLVNLNFIIRSLKFEYINYVVGWFFIVSIITFIAIGVLALMIGVDNSRRIFNGLFSIAVILNVIFLIYTLHFTSKTKYSSQHCLVFTLKTINTVVHYIVFQNIIPDYTILLVLYMIIFIINTTYYPVIKVEDTEENEVLFNLQVHSIAIWMLVFYIALHTYYLQ